MQRGTRDGGGMTGVSWSGGRFRVGKQSNPMQGVWRQSDPYK